MLKIEYTAKMKRDIKRVEKRGKDMTKLYALLKLLAAQTPVPERYRDHRLSGDMADLRECHIEPDWLLVYKIYENELILTASGTGTHSDIFDE
jgi:mRNA interferase YafQ